MSCINIEDRREYMSYASDMKKELTMIEITKDREFLSELSALIKMNGMLNIANGRLSLSFQTENASIARRMYSLIKFFYNVHINISVRKKYPKGDKFSLKVLIKQISVSFWALAAVLIVVFGVVGGIFTATESAAIAVIYSLIVSVFIYKGLDWKGVWKTLEECVNTLSIVLILISTSSIFGYCLTTLHVPDMAASAITGFTNNPIILALLLNLILLILGCIMDMAPIILIATPILLPIANSIGIGPIQFGVMVILNCGIGLLTPPVGGVLFIGSAVAKLPMEKVVKATLPFYLCMIITLLLITFIPVISLGLPMLLGSL